MKTYEDIQDLIAELELIKRWLEQAGDGADTADTIQKTLCWVLGTWDRLDVADEAADGHYARFELWKRKLSQSPRPVV